MIEISEFSKVGSPLPEVRAIDDGSDDSRPSFWTQLWYGVAVCAIAVNIAAMVLEGPVVAVVAGVVAVAIAPFVIFYQTKLENTNCTCCCRCRFYE